MIGKLVFLLLTTVQLVSAQMVGGVVHKVAPTTVGGGTTVSDDFAGTGALSGSWTVANGSADRLSGVCEDLGNDVDLLAWYAGTFTASQYSSVKTITFTNTLWDGVGPLVRGSGTGNGFTGYIVDFKVGTGQTCTLYKITANLTYSSLGTRSCTSVANDVFRLEATGTSTTTLRMFINGVQQGADFTDASSPITSGNPGMFMYRNSGSYPCTLDDFAGGDL